MFSSSILTSASDYSNLAPGRFEDTIDTSHTDLLLDILIWFPLQLISYLFEALQLFYIQQYPVQTFSATFSTIFFFAHSPLIDKKSTMTLSSAFVKFPEMKTEEDPPLPSYLPSTALSLVSAPSVGLHLALWKRLSESRALDWQLSVHPKTPIMNVGLIQKFSVVGWTNAPTPIVRCSSMPRT